MVEVKAYTPYIYQLKTVKSTILYYGTEHTFDVHSDVFRDVQDIISSYQPNLVLVEGVLQLKNNKRQFIDALIRLSKEDVIKRYGENVYTAYISGINHIDIDCPEPMLANEINYMITQGYSTDDIFFYYMCQFISQWNRNRIITLDKYLKKSITYYNYYKADICPLYTMDMFIELSKKYLAQYNKQVNNVHFFNDLIDPFPRISNLGLRNSIINQVSVVREEYRDSYIVNQISCLSKKYSRIFIVFGASHVGSQITKLKNIYFGDAMYD